MSGLSYHQGMRSHARQPQVTQITTYASQTHVPGYTQSRAAFKTPTRLRPELSSWGRTAASPQVMQTSPGAQPPPFNPSAPLSTTTSNPLYTTSSRTLNPILPNSPTVEVMSITKKVPSVADPIPDPIYEDNDNEKGTSCEDGVQATNPNMSFITMSGSPLCFSAGASWTPLNGSQVVYVLGELVQVRVKEVVTLPRVVADGQQGVSGEEEVWLDARVVRQRTLTHLPAASRHSLLPPSRTSRSVVDLSHPLPLLPDTPSLYDVRVDALHSSHPFAKLSGSFLSGLPPSDLRRAGTRYDVGEVLLAQFENFKVLLRPPSVVNTDTETETDETDAAALQQRYLQKVYCKVLNVSHNAAKEGDELEVELMVVAENNEPLSTLKIAPKCVRRPVRLALGDAVEAWVVKGAWRPCTVTGITSKGHHCSDGYFYERELLRAKRPALSDAVITEALKACTSGEEAVRILENLPEVLCLLAQPASVRDLAAGHTDFVAAFQDIRKIEPPFSLERVHEVLKFHSRSEVAYDALATSQTHDDDTDSEHSSEEAETDNVFTYAVYATIVIAVLCALGVLVCIALPYWRLGQFASPNDTEDIELGLFLVKVPYPELRNFAYGDSQPLFSPKSSFENWVPSGVGLAWERDNMDSFKDAGITSLVLSIVAVLCALWVSERCVFCLRGKNRPERMPNSLPISVFCFGVFAVGSALVYTAIVTKSFDFEADHPLVGHDSKPGACWIGTLCIGVFAVLWSIALCFVGMWQGAVLLARERNKPVPTQPPPHNPFVLHAAVVSQPQQRGEEREHIPAIPQTTDLPPTTSTVAVNEEPRVQTPPPQPSPSPPSPPSQPIQPTKELPTETPPPSAPPVVQPESIVIPIPEQIVEEPEVEVEVKVEEKVKVVPKRVGGPPPPRNMPPAFKMPAPPAFKMPTPPAFKMPVVTKPSNPVTEGVEKEGESVPVEAVVESPKPAVRNADPDNQLQTPPSVPSPCPQSSAEGSVDNASMTSSMRKGKRPPPIMHPDAVPEGYGKKKNKMETEIALWRHNRGNTPTIYQKIMCSHPPFSPRLLFFLRLPNKDGH